MAQSLEERAIAAKVGIGPNAVSSALMALTRNRAQPGDAIDQSGRQAGMLGETADRIGRGPATRLGAVGSAAPQTEPTRAPVDMGLLGDLGAAEPEVAKFHPIIRFAILAGLPGLFWWVLLHLL